MVRTELVIASGVTETVASGETQDTATVSNAGTFENAGTNTAGGQQLTTTATDIDTSTATLTRIRELDATAKDIDTGAGILNRIRKLTTVRFVTFSIQQGDTQTVQSGEIESRGDVQNAGTVSNAGTYQTGVKTPTVKDIDAATASAFILVGVESERAVATVKEILTRTKDKRWSIDPPTVLNYWDRTQQERGQGADQPAEIYVWETAGKDIERFSLDNTSTHDTASVEALVYSLDEQEVIDYAEDARNILERYFDVNKSPTEWQTIEVTSVNDFREQTQRRSTDQYVVSLEIELEKIQSV